MMATGIRLKEKTKPIGKKLEGIAHPHRVAILYLLSHQPFPMHEITENLDIAPNLVSHHLDILIKTGWIQKTKSRKTVTYQLKRRTCTEIKKFFEETPFGRTFFL